MTDEELNRRFARLEATSMMLLASQNIIIAIVSKLADLEDDPDINMAMNVTTAAIQALERDLKKEGYDAQQHDA